MGKSAFESLQFGSKGVVIELTSSVIPNISLQKAPFVGGSGDESSPGVPSEEPVGLAGGLLDPEPPGEKMTA